MSNQKQRPVAFVTGASRGIGRAAALALAEHGYDIVVTARTVTEGQAADGRPLPGSIASTAEEVRKRGGKALPIRLDLLDEQSIREAIDTTRKEWGGIDLLLNNGIYTGPANMVEVMDIEANEMDALFKANVFAPTLTTQLVLPEMAERNRGTIINMVSAAGFSDPPAPAGKGGWGYAYAASKAAIARMVGVLAAEYAETALKFFNVEPGFVMTEAMHLNDPDGELSKRMAGAPPAAPAAVIAWLATNSDAASWHGQTVSAQPLCLELGLIPDWRD